VELFYERFVAIAGVLSMKTSDGTVHGEDPMRGTVEDSVLLTYMVLAKAKTGGVPLHVRFSNDRGALNPLARQGLHASHRPTQLQSTKNHRGDPSFLMSTRVVRRWRRAAGVRRDRIGPAAVLRLTSNCRMMSLFSNRACCRLS
jgi:hypothetical protein